MGAISGLLWRFMSCLRPYRGPSLLILIGLLLEMAFNSAVPFSLKFIVDKALLGGNQRLLLWILAGLGGGVVVVALAGLVRDRLYSRLVANVMTDVRVRIFDHLQRLSMDYYARTRIGDILSHFSGDLAVIETATTSAIPWAILPGLDVISSTTLLFVLDWRLALVAMLVWPLILIGPRIFAPHVVEESYRRKEEEAQMLGAVQENVNAQPIIKAFGLTEYARATFLQRSEDLKERMIRVGFFGALVERSAGVGIMGLQVLVMGIGAFMVAKEMLTVGSLASFLAIFLSLSYSLSYVTQYVPNLVQAAGGMRRIEELLAEEPRVSDRSAAPLPRLSREISLQDVTFGYTPEQTNLKSATLSIRRGTSVAFVGRSGSGKSTLLNLVMRFYDPARGSVAIDGVDLRAGSQQSLRAQMSFVFQESFLFNISIRENIRLGRPGATDAEVEAAAKAAEIHDMILELSQGYDTPAGERGGRLSGGQRQRVAIARAILRNPEILILDEATSALDPATECTVNATLARIARGRTTLAVTHRLASVVDVDRIVVLDAGWIREQGSHEELLDANGLYKELWDKQSGFQLSHAGDHATVTADRLCAIPIFEGMDRHLLEETTSLFSTDQYPEDRIVVHEGDVGDRLFIIVRGKVEVLKTGADHTPRRIAVLQDGDHFGEVALLQSVPRTATVKTLTPCVFLTLRRGEFTYLLDRVPELRGKLENALEERAARGKELAAVTA
jgi:ATP-binding cassette, subfamily B, bacterial